MAYQPLLTYPTTLREDASTGKQPFMSFALKKEGDPTIDSKKMIFMYLPSSLAVSDGASYSGVNLGTGRAIGALRDEAKGTESVSNMDVQAGLLAAMKEGGGATASVAAESSIASGVALNPFTNMTFEGMTMRSWSFDFKMISESADEAKPIRDIENFFRKNMYAESTGALSLKYPPLVRTQFWDGEEESRFLPMIMDSYITGLSVTYNESNSMYHDDGAPVETNMQIQLSEHRSLTKNDLYMKESLQYNRGGRDNSDLENALTPEEASGAHKKKLDEDKKKEEDSE